MTNLTQAELTQLDEILSKAIDQAFEQVALSAAARDGDTIENLNRWSQENGPDIKEMFGLETVEATNQFMKDCLIAAAKRITG